MLMIPRVHRIWKTVRKKPMIVAKMSLCGSQRRGSTMMDAMKSDLPDVIRDVIQANYWVAPLALTNLVAYPAAS